MLTNEKLLRRYLAARGFPLISFTLHRGIIWAIVAGNFPSSASAWYKKKKSKPHFGKEFTGESIIYPDVPCLMFDEKALLIALENEKLGGKNE